ncbi:MAG: hypothetical protein H6908_00375 [Hyphomicrobiales bacterium]|nr:hypothetical protein [Hyphomicrobiales bacterium]
MLEQVGAPGKKLAAGIQFLQGPGGGADIMAGGGGHDYSGSHMTNNLMAMMASRGGGHGR